jgi:hypothetical protein
MAAGHDLPFTRAFAAWFATAADLHIVMVIEPCVDRDAVDIKFLTGGGALQGYAHAAGISISALWEGECWDFLHDRDVVAEFGPGGWFCTLCPADDRSHFPSIKALWEDHLFRPLKDWITTQLNSAKAIGFYCGDGVTWAKLIADDQGDDPPDNSVQLAQSTASL